MLNDDMSRSRYLVLAAVIAISVLLFYGLTIRSGQNWDGDYALYIMQAETIAEGRPYDSERYIFNPKNLIHPDLYPPGLPLLLAPIYKAFGLDLELMKWVAILSFVGFVFVFAPIARTFLPPWFALAATALIGAHPFFWDLKDTIYAELPFQLFCYAALLSAHRLIDSETNCRRAWTAAGLAALIALAYIMRTGAIALFPAILALALYRTRRITHPAIAALTGAAVLIAALDVLFPSDTATYFSFFDEFSLRGAVLGAWEYAMTTGVLLQDQFLPWRAVKVLVILGFLTLALIGFLAKIAKRITIFEMFTLAYGGMLLVYPLRSDRYVIPLWPLLLLYALHGAVALGAWSANHKMKLRLPVFVTAGLACAFAWGYTTKDFGPLDPSITDPRAVELYEAIKNVVPSDAVMLSRKPTIVAMFTDRVSATWPRNFVEDNEFWDYANSIGATYLIQDHRHYGDGDYDPADRLDAFVRAHKGPWTLVFENEWFAVFAFDQMSPALAK